MRSFLKFFWVALRNPLQVSTAFQTGKTASFQMISAIPDRVDGMIVELGVGTGAITESLVRKVPSPKQYVGLELNEELLEFVQERFPQLRFVNESAENFARVLEGRSVSAVVSSLPWTLMPAEAVKQTLDSVREHLEVEGVFATYMTLHVLMTPAGRRFQELLRERFSRIETTIILENLPPAKIFIVKK